MEFLPQTGPSGLFTLFACAVSYVLGLLSYRWATKNQAEELARLEAQLKALDDKRRGL